MSLLPNAGEGGRRPDEGDTPRCQTPNYPALTRPVPASGPRATSPGLGRGDTTMSLLPNAGEGGRRPDEGDTPRCQTPNYPALTRPVPASGPRATSPGLGRGDTTMSLLPNAGEGGRRPDEGACLAASPLTTKPGTQPASASRTRKCKSGSTPTRVPARSRNCCSGLRGGP